MKNFLAIFIYFGKFVTNPDFQDEQAWVKWVIKKASSVHQDVWTGVRFFGWVTIFINRYNPWLGFLSLNFFSLTDWFDGKVARFNNGREIDFEKYKSWIKSYFPFFYSSIIWLSGKIEKLKSKLGENFKALYDATADKFFALPILLNWGNGFCGYGRFITLIAVEVVGNILLIFFFKNGIIKKEEGDLYKHNLVGKLKMGLESFLMPMMWFANQFTPGWEFWPEFIGRFMDVIIIMAIFSIAIKMLNGEKK